MDADYFEQYVHFERGHWWFVARRRIFLSLLRRFLPDRPELDILDAGCGSGINIQHLSELGRTVGVDRALAACRHSLRTHQARVIGADLTALPIGERRFDLVTAWDVLEHVEDDSAAVEELLRVLRPGGLLMVAVPALPALWSEQDEINHHFRRYRERELLGLLARAGGELVYVTHLNTFLLPVAFAVRTWQRVRSRLVGFRRRTLRTDFVDHHRWVNWLLMAAFSAEEPIVARGSLPVGLSLLCLCRRAER